MLHRASQASTNPLNASAGAPTPTTRGSGLAHQVKHPDVPDDSSAGPPAGPRQRAWASGRHPPLTPRAPGAVDIGDDSDRHGPHRPRGAHPRLHRGARDVPLGHPARPGRLRHEPRARRPDQGARGEPGPLQRVPRGRPGAGARRPRGSTATPSPSSRSRASSWPASTARPPRAAASCACRRSRPPSRSSPRCSPTERMPVTPPDVRPASARARPQPRSSRLSPTVSSTDSSDGHEEHDEAACGASAGRTRSGLTEARNPSQAFSACCPPGSIRLPAPGDGARPRRASRDPTSASTRLGRPPRRREFGRRSAPGTAPCATLGSREGSEDRVTRAVEVARAGWGLRRR